MLSSIAKLLKFIRLEIERGYDNRAVVGGLDKILPAWEREARANQLDEGLIQAAKSGLQAYPTLEPDQRAGSLTELMSQLEAAAQDTDAGETRPPSPAEMQDPTPDDLLAGANKSQFSRKEPARPPEQKKPVPPKRGANTYKSGVAGLDAPPNVLQGVGTRLTETLATLGLNTLEDMLYYFPRRYDDYSQLRSINRLVIGEVTTVLATIQSITNRPIRGGKLQLTEAIVTDGTGFLRVSWFNQPWLTNRYSAGTQVVLAGKIEQYLGRPVMNSPEIEPIETEHLHTNRIVPVYPLTAKLNQKNLRRLLHQTVTYWAPRVTDYLPEQVRSAVKVIPLQKALLNIHFPESQDMLDTARWRLAFDEIFLLQLGVLRQKRSWQSAEAQVFEVSQEWIDNQTSRLPYQLTSAQRRAVQDIRNDLASGHPMDRLLQGDVGSGKTVVAALAITMVTSQGAQAAIMAPTSILAEQHYRSFLRLLAGVQPVEPTVPEKPAVKQSPRPTTLADLMEAIHQEIETDNANEFDEAGLEVILPDETEAEEEALPIETEELAIEDETVSTALQDELPTTEQAQPQSNPPLLPQEIRLLVGDTPEAEKQEIREGLLNGTIKVVIGTHALIESPVQFQRLQLAVVDEQHRFGVAQRAALRAKGDSPHLLVMTATPIPRSLALTVYGDLDLSVMDEMPPGRQPVGTFVIGPLERERAYTLIQSQVEKGHQAFIIYPLVEPGESENGQNESNAQLSAVEEHRRLQSKVFPRLKVGLLHGRMKPDEKDEVMKRFRDRDFDILVSTTVIEVGVDVPNATVMLIEGANRFGLAQLHQLRGRIGRGSAKSYCLLIPDHEDALENERLAVMTETNDGFVLAERDLQQRGPGDFLGTRQAGFAELKLANLTDVRLIEKARQQAQSVFKDDPDLTSPEHEALARRLEQFWEPGRGDIS